MFTIDKQDTGEFIVSATFSVELSLISQDYVFLIDNITDFEKVVSFEDTVTGILDTRGLKREYSLSTDLSNWSEWLDLPLGELSEVPDINIGQTHHIRIKWTRIGTNADGVISISEFKLTGNWSRDEEVFLNPSVITLTTLNEDVFYTPPNIYKAFSISDFEIITSTLSDTNQLNIQYRISQDSGRHWTEWEDLTKTNISTFKINPIRFFMIEYKLTKVGTDMITPIKIFDLNLLGDFQNVSLDYFKSNLLGIRDCCVGGYIGEDAYNANGAAADGLVPTGLEDCPLPSILSGFIDDDKKSLLFNPYDLGKAVQLYSGLSNITNEIFGHTVEYFVTDPDIKGTDTTMHEYQLYNVVCVDDLKILVVENNFPDNQIMFNQFDLSLFETFEIHITKQAFKEVFGVDKRPSKEDFLWFCQLNRMYQVEHAQPFRDFNNSSVYYKVILKKYNQKASVKGATPTIQDRINQLTKNTTIDELMGVEIRNEQKATANTDQQRTLTHDVVRHEVLAKINKELIENASVVINKYNYNLETVAPTDNAITYRKVDDKVGKGDNRAYSAWFNIEEFVVNDLFNFATNYDFDQLKGYMINLENGNFVVTWNNDTYLLPVDDFVKDNTWYCYVVNIDQRQKKIEQFLYERLDGGNSKFAKLKLVTSVVEDLNIREFEFEKDKIDITIKGSPMKLTNIRIYNDVVDTKIHDKLLNQNIVRDEDYVILADNANRRPKLPNFSYGTEDATTAKNTLKDDGFEGPAGTS